MAKKNEIDFSKLIVEDVEGKPIDITDFHKLVGNMIYNNSRTLDLLEVAQRIHKTGKAELDKKTANQIMTIFQNQELPLAAFVRKPIIDALKPIAI